MPAFLALISVATLLLAQETVVINIHRRPVASAGGGAPAFQTRSLAAAATAVNCNAGEPAGTVQGDVLVGGFIVAGIGTAALPVTWATVYTGTSDSNAFRWFVGYIVRGASAADTNFTNASAYRECSILRISGANATPIDSQSANGSTSNGSAAPTPPATTATSACNSSLCLVVTGGMHWNGTDTANGWCVANYTVRSDNAQGNDMYLATSNAPVSAGSVSSGQAFDGGTGSTCATGSNTMGSGNAYWNGFTITIKP